MFRKSTKAKCHKTLHSLGALVSKCYRKLSAPFSCSRKQDYMFFEDMLSESVFSGMDEKRLLKEEEINAGSFMNFLKPSPVKVLQNKDSSPRRASKRGNGKKKNVWDEEEYTYSRESHCGGLQLERKMRELEMMDSDDLEHVLDIEEVLHCYSRLNTPVYIDIVDKFFTHICSDINSPLSSSA